MKRTVLKFKHEPTDDNKMDQEWRNYPVREYPGMPAWVYLSAFMILAIGVSLGFWEGGHSGSCFGLLLGMAACFLLVAAVHSIRCPQCKGSVNTREVEEENGFKRFFHDCLVCRISWKCEKRHWNSSAD